MREGQFHAFNTLSTVGLDTCNLVDEKGAMHPYVPGTNPPLEVSARPIGPITDGGGVDFLTLGPKIILYNNILQGASIRPWALSRGAGAGGGGARGAIAPPQLFVSMGWICMCPPPLKFGNH